MVSRILLIAFFFTLFGWNNLSGQKVEHLIQDAPELNTFYSALGGSVWTQDENWPVSENIEDSLKMPFGLTFIITDTIEVNDSTSRYVYETTQIILQENGLSGEIPAVVLPELRKLSAWENEITGVSPGLSAPLLAEVSLGRNQISSWDALGLPSLTLLELPKNDLTEIPGSGSYPSLTYLNLIDNPIDQIPTNLDFPSLETLWLYDCNIKGPLPDLNLPNLEKLELGNNQFEGPMPAFLNLKKLKKLDITRSNLTGPLPTSFGFNSTIEVLELSGNEFSGALPAYNFPNLRELHLARDTSYLSGPLPNWNMPKIEFLTLSANVNINQFSGGLPNWNMPELETLNLMNCQLSGPLPPMNYPKLKVMALARNQFSGTIPSFDFPECTYFDLSFNQLDSLIYLNVPQANVVYLANNKLKVEFPEISCSGFVDVFGNQFTGTFPYLGESISALNLNFNKFEGIDPAYANSGQFSTLSCASNRLDFDDLLPFQNISFFRYSPQDSIPMYEARNQQNQRVLIVEEGGGTNFQWYRNGTILNGEISDQIVIGNHNSKEYTCAVTNPDLPDLTLFTRLVQKPGARCWENDYFKICLEDAEAGWLATDNDHEIQSSEVIVFNEFLYFDGSCTIDTQQLSVVVDGAFRLKEVPLPGGGTGNFKLAEGKYDLALAGASGTLTGFINDQLSTFTPDIGGLEIKLDELLLLGGKSADGVSISFTVAFDALSPGCGNGSPATTQISISGLEMRRSGISVSGLQVGDLGFAPGFCLKELGASYDQDKDKLSFGLTLLTPFIEVGGGLGFIAGEVDSIAMRAVLQNAIIPIGATGVGLIGCEGRISSLTNPPWNMRFGGIFSAVASDDLFRLTTSVEYIPPSTLKVEAGDGKFFNPPVFDDWWQVEGGIYGSIDLRDYKMKVGGMIDMAPFLDNGEKKFIGSGAVDLTYRRLNERGTFLGTFEGMLTLPNLGSHFPFDWLSAKVGLPYSASADGLLIHKYQTQFMMGYLDLGGRIGRLQYRLEYSRAFDNFDYFTLTRVKANVNSGLAEDGSQEFVIPAETRMAVVRVGTGIDAQATDLTDPSGNVWTATNPGPDATLDEEGEKFFWTLYAPEVGTWVFSGPENAELDVYLFGEQSAFTVEQNIEGDSLYLSWSAFDFMPGDSLDFFADEDTLGSNGGYFATVDAMDGGYRIHLSELSTFCSFYVQAVGVRQGQLVSDYAEGMIQNPIQPLMLPEEIVANYYADSGLLVLDWIPVQDPDVVGYMIELVEGQTRTMIGNVYADVSSFRYPLSDLQGKSISIVSYGADGAISCPSGDIAVVTSVDQEWIERSASTMRLYPNPNYGRALLDVFTDQAAEGVLSVYSIEGRLMYRAEQSYRQGWNQQELQLAHLPKGYYVVQLILPEQQLSVKMIRLSE